MRNRIGQKISRISQHGAPKQTRRDNFARSLRIARRAARLTQRELAVRVGVDHSFISLLEAGARDIDLVGYATVVRIASELNQPAADLFPVPSFEREKTA